MRMFTLGIIGYWKELWLRLSNARDTEVELVASKEKLEIQAAEIKRLNEDLEQFAYIISHDLKAPVRNISSFMKLLSTRFSAGVGQIAQCGLYWWR